MFWSFGLILLICDFGEMVTIKFDSFDMDLWQCDWYLYSIEMQRIYKIFMSHTQLPTNIRGYGDIKCTRDTFQKVFVR